MLISRTFRNFIVMGLLAASCTLGIVSCAALGTKVTVAKPEALSSCRKIVVWPITAYAVLDRKDEKDPDFISSSLANDPAFEAQCKSISQYAEVALMNELTASEFLQVIGPDSVIGLVSQYNPNFTGFGDTDWRVSSNLIDADGFLITKLAFGTESDGFQIGVNTYVTMSLFDASTGELAIEAKFNTKWGKSYLFAKSENTTVPDAVHGAANALLKKLRKYRESGGESEK